MPLLRPVKCIRSDVLQLKVREEEARLASLQQKETEKQRATKKEPSRRSRFSDTPPPGAVPYPPIPKQVNESQKQDFKLALDSYPPPQLPALSPVKSPDTESKPKEKKKSPPADRVILDLEELEKEATRKKADDFRIAHRTKDERLKHLKAMTLEEVTSLIEGIDDQKAEGEMLEDFKNLRELAKSVEHAIVTEDQEVILVKNIVAKYHPIVI